MTRLHLKDFWRYSKQQMEKRNEQRVLVCGGPGCLARGSQAVYEALLDASGRVGGTGTVVEHAAHMVGCHGLCDQGPLVIIEPQGTFYTHVNPEMAPRIYHETLRGGRVVEDFLYSSGTGRRIARYADIPFYQRQQKIALRNVGAVDPEDINDYVALGGYRAAAKALEDLSPEDVIGWVKDSQLRGRGGAGFPTGRKWEVCAQAPGENRYVIANGDEGDPGAFMDRTIMEGDPHSLLEGMIIGAYAVGASEGFIYVREEYPLAVERLKGAIGQAESLGLLGDDILGIPGFCFNLSVRRGGGAFVCGEATALINSLEGRLGEPRGSYVVPAVRGYNQQPTALNNVETFCVVPEIINKGPAWFAAIGSEASRGTKTFSLVGRAVHIGLIEVPMGMSLREIIYDVGGGIEDGRTFKAVQTGGPSGGCLSAEYLDLPVDFDALEEAGSMMGSGGLIVMDETTCMVDVARYFLAFLRDESCGQCVPCREGLFQLTAIFDRIVSGEGQESDLAAVEELAVAMQEGSLCGLGQSASNPVLSTLRHFRGEYTAHIREKCCPAGVCRALTAYVIDVEKCRACGRCLEVCPAQCIAVSQGVYTIDREACTRCGACSAACPFAAISREGCVQ